jgi:16S rRNA C967 or C1407 C5-methylase (RsmB/RsmF family)
MKKSIYAAFERYRPIIDDWAAFEAALSRPLPTCLWANPLRTTPQQLARFLAEDGLQPEPLSWYPGGFKLAADFKPGLHWTFLAGLCHSQEAVSMLPVLLLDPRPGERVLDLCAAPGNKTAQMAVAMANQGTVVANDINFGRMRAARQTQERLGLVNLSTTIWDGANYPNAAGLFDKILVDASCSCEGTSRKEPAVLNRVGPELSGRKSSSQQALLRRAVQLCRPGGRVVYATCTYAPEENEQVVDAVLQEFSDTGVQVGPAQAAGIASSPGLTAWNGHQFDPSLRHACRIWPHQNDTGGFFMAVLEKLALNQTGNGDNDDRHSIPKILGKPPVAKSLLDILAKRFDLLPEDFEPNLLYQATPKRVYLINQDHRPPVQPGPDAVGLYFMKTRVKYPKLSTAAALHIGAGATRNFLEVDRPQLEAYVNRQVFAVSSAQTRYCTGPGYVLVRHRGFTVGVAFFEPHQPGRGGEVGSLFPKGWSPAKGGRCEEGGVT